MRFLPPKTGFVIFLALSAIVIFPRRALAYLDPGTGSYLFQVFLAAVFGGLFAIKIFWKKIRLFLRKIFSKNSKGEKTD